MVKDDPHGFSTKKNELAKLCKMRKNNLQK